MILVALLLGTVVPDAPPPQRFNLGEGHPAELWLPVPPIPYPTEGKAALGWECQLKTVSDGKLLNVAGMASAIPPPAPGAGMAPARSKMTILPDPSHSFSGEFIATYSHSTLATYGIFFRDQSTEDSKRYFEVDARNTPRSKGSMDAGLYEVVERKLTLRAQGPCVAKTATRERG